MGKQRFLNAEITFVCANRPCVWHGMTSTIKPVLLSERTCFVPALRCAACGDYMEEVGT